MHSNININIDEEKYLCPLTLYYMKEPVLASDGKIYEKKAIKKWYNENKTSPFTREILDGKFILQKKLKTEIKDYLKNNNIDRDDADDNYYESLEEQYIRDINCPFCNLNLLINSNHINRYCKCPRCLNRLYFSRVSEYPERRGSIIIPNNNENMFFCQIM